MKKEVRQFDPSHSVVHTGPACLSAVWSKAGAFSAHRVQLAKQLQDGVGVKVALRLTQKLRLSDLRPEMKVQQGRPILLTFQSQNLCTLRPEHVSGLISELHHLAEKNKRQSLIIL